MPKNQPQRIIDSKRTGSTGSGTGGSAPSIHTHDSRYYTESEVNALLGSIDHGGLAGLADDDHTQYLLAATFGGRAAMLAAWTDLTDAGATTLHKHDHGSADGLADDDHSQYHNDTRGDARYSVLAHTHASYIGTALTSGNILVGNASNVAAAVAMSGDATISNTGAVSVNKTRLNVRNETGTTIDTTKAVYVSGFNNLPLVALADNTNEAKHNVIGVTVGSIAHQANGYIATSGQFDAETNAWTVGVELYMSTAGALTTTEPTSGTVRHVGIVTVKGNYPAGKILIYTQPEEYVLGMTAGTDMNLRMGDSAGANKVSFRDYANNEVGSVNSDGVIAMSNFSGTNTGDNAANTSSIAKSLLDAKGDLIVASANDTPAKLAVTGVTAGWVLTADDGQALGMKWAAPAGGAGDVATDVIWDTKGDLAVATGANTAAKLPAGANGKVLQTASGETTGLQWVAITKVLTLGISGVIAVAAGATRLYVPWSCTVTNIRAMVGVAPTGASIIVDVHYDGTTIFSTQGNRPTITATNFTDLSSAPDTTALVADHYLTLDVDQVGSTIAGSNLIVQIEVTVP